MAGGGSNNNTEAGIDDLPPMRLGHEISNDLRNIQLTFSNQPPARERSANPLKHLIRSRHNFRALVTYGGYLFPINILLNVILLGRGWLAYPTVETDGNIHTVSNPVGYLATSVVSLVLIVCSGVCFILRCIEYDVVITTMTSIIANFVNAVLILAIAIMYLKNERPKHPGARLTGEYYCSYAGAMVALLNALLLLLDVLVTPGFRYRGSGMSRQQRLLQFNIIVVVVWIGIGGYVWSKIEDWDTITSVMFCMVSVTTIGFGNRSPTKVYSRVLILIYGPLGILMFGMMLLHTRNVIIQITKSKFSRAKRGLEARRKKIEQEATLHQVKRRLAAHPEQRSCKSVVVGFLGRVFLPHERRVRIGIPRWLRRRLDEEEEEEDEQPHYLGDMSNSNRGTGLSGHGTAEVAQEHGLPLSGTAEGAAAAARESHPGSHNSQHFAATDHSPPHENSEHAGDTGNSDQPPHPVVRSYTTASRISQVREAINRPGFLRRIRRRAGADGRRRASDSAGSASDHDSETKPEDAGGNGRLELQANYTRSSHDSAMGGQVGREASRASGVSKKSGNKSKYGQRGKRDGGLRDITKQLWVALLLNIFFWCASACIFFAFERPQWTYFDALYFCYVAYTTIGYGDIVPKTTEGEIAFICLCFVAVGLETFLVVSAVSYFSDLLSRGLRRTRVQRRIEKRRRSLIAYEIRRHIKHPNYNPFSHGEEDRLVQEGITSLKRAMAHVVELFRGKRSLKNAFKRRHTADQRQRDEVLAEGFIRQATGLGGFGMTEWQPPSPPASPVTSPLGTPQPFPQSPHASPAETPSLSESPDEPRAETQALENHQPEPATGSANASPTA
ncbi:Potassium channel [Coemansia thaxteri]|uniref:Potassium channel n=1 Tax=Coemansia thaxteri TaxID=2663907 RepID=A0A9W8BDT6_9FUNG|nr:Potassium channel [Coemansia thaxteri]